MSTSGAAPPRAVEPLTDSPVPVQPPPNPEAIRTAAADYHRMRRGHFPGYVRTIEAVVTAQPAPTPRIGALDNDTRVAWACCDALIDALHNPADNHLSGWAAAVATIDAYPGRSGPVAYTAGISAAEHAALLADLGEAEALSRLQVLAALT